MYLHISSHSHRANVAKVYEQLEAIDIDNATDVLTDKEIKKFEKWLERVTDALHHKMNVFDKGQLANHYQK